MRTILTRSLICGIILCLGIISCKKPVETDKDPDFVIVNDTVRLKSGDKIVRINFDEIVSQISDELAKEYINKYEESFPESEKFPRAFIIDKKAYDKILKDKNPNDLYKFLLTEKDSTMNVIYQNGSGKKFNFNLNVYSAISDSEYANMDRDFNQNLYGLMNARIMNLSSRTIQNNTKEISIPLDDLKKMNLKEPREYIFLLPGVITRDTETSNGLKNQKNHITLIAGLWTIEGLKLKFQKITVFYDNFCVSPPNDC
jgi:hypothetical protein